MTWSSFDRLTDRRRHRSCPNKSSTLGAVAICVATGSLTSCSCTPPDSQIPARRQAQARTRSNSAKLADRRGPQPAAFRDRPQQDEGRRVAINGMPGRQPGLRASWLARQVRGDLLEDLESSHGYVGIRAHGRAKLLLLAWTIALARRSEEHTSELQSRGQLVCR